MRLWEVASWSLRIALTPEETRRLVSWVRRSSGITALEVAHASGYREGYHAGATDGFLQGQRAAQVALRVKPSDA